MLQAVANAGIECNGVSRWWNQLAQDVRIAKNRDVWRDKTIDAKLAQILNPRLVGLDRLESRVRLLESSPWAISLGLSARQERRTGAKRQHDTRQQDGKAEAQHNLQIKANGGSNSIITT